MILRAVENEIRSAINTVGKAVILLGARQVGKTTLLKTIFGSDKNVLWLTGDSLNDRALLSANSIEHLRVIIGSNQVLIVDEAQRIQNIGLILKLIIDNIPQVKIVATGSSSFELTNSINEPLTGRKIQYTLFPLAFTEMAEHNGLHAEINLLQHRLIYGYYPDVVNNPGQERELLSELTESYLFKDILSLDKVRKPEHLTHLLRALAYQIGSQVSYTEIGQLCGLDNKTVEKYIDALEQTFVIFRLKSYSRNLRNELKKSRKIYFTDNGVRNAIIADYRPLELRDDIGKLWENFMVSERVKYNRYTGNYANLWFWRTDKQQEVDYIEERDGCMSAFEFKWAPSTKVKCPRAYTEAYPDSSFSVIHKDNFVEFLL